MSKSGPAYGPVGVGEGVGVGIVGVEGVSCGAGNWVGVVLAVVVSSIVTGGGASWVGGKVTGTFRLQPSSSASIRISAIKMLRFILTPTLVGDSFTHCQIGNPIMRREATGCKLIYGG